MHRPGLTYFYWILLSTLLFSSCTKKTSDFEILEFNCATNKEFKQTDSIISIDADLSDGALYGIRIPTYSQCENGKIAFNFKIQKKATCKEKLNYKLFYQNETYKFDEAHEYSGENFYGSWENTDITFKELPEFTNDISVQDSLVILGNPRNEGLYFGENPANKVANTKLLANTIAYIKDDKVWYGQIVKKAQEEKRSVEDQLTLDAMWSVNEQLKKESVVNNRSWRNPRMGKYEFMLVVVSESALQKLPYHQKHINLPTILGSYVNPFSFFKIGKGADWNNVIYAMGNK